MSMRQASKAMGFTLIEVLVALGIVAVALLAAGKASNSLIDNTERFGRVTLAQLCAENEMIAARLSKQTPPIGDTESECKQAGITFNQKITIRPTPNAGFRRMDVQVLDDRGPVLTLSTLIAKDLMRAPICRPVHGFTLVEMLLAIAIMAVMAGLSWRGLDAMAQSKRHNEAYRQQVLALQASFAQWSADLDAMQQPNAQTPLQAQPEMLRFVRQAPANAGVDAGYIVVVYAKDSRKATGPSDAPRWVRWQSTPFTNHQGLAVAWAQSSQWMSALNGSTVPLPAGQEPLTLALIQSWKLQFFADGAWQEQAPVAAFPAATLPYEAIRLELELAPNQGLYGTVRRDWIAPRAGGTR